MWRYALLGTALATASNRTLNNAKSRVPRISLFFDERLIRTGCMLIDLGLFAVISNILTRWQLFNSNSV